MTIKTTFLLPDFDKNIPDKVNEKVQVKSRHVLSITEASNWHSSIATSGFRSKTDGVYVFTMKIDEIGNGNLFVGFTDLTTYDSKKSGFLGGQLTGPGLCCYSGDRRPGDDRYLSDNMTKKAKELYEKQLEVKDQQLCAKDQVWQQQLSAKDQQHQQTRESFLGQLDVKDKQLELERAEHQKTKNLLHQIKMELKDMEIYYLTKEKESGQRRQREEEKDQFKVKQEPSD